MEGTGEKSQCRIRRWRKDGLRTEKGKEALIGKIFVEFLRIPKLMKKLLKFKGYV